MNRAGTDTSNRGQMSATYDSREVLLRNKGAIHVVKDEIQILPYCILHLNGGHSENAPGLHRTTEPTLYELTGPNVPGRANVPRGLAPSTNLLSAAASTTASWILRNSQTESSGQGLLQHQQQQSNPAAASSSSRPQGQETSTESTLFKPMRTNLVGESSSVHWQSTEYNKIVERLFEILPHLPHIELHLKVNRYLGERLTKTKGSSENGIDVALAVNEISEAIFSENDIDVALAVNEISEAIFNAETDFVPMRTDPTRIRDKLFTGIDGEYNVTNMVVVFEVIGQLESFDISVKELEATGLDMHINELRRKAEEKALAATSPTDDVALATSAKNLIKKWDSVKERLKKNTKGECWG